MKKLAAAVLAGAMMTAPLANAQTAVPATDTKVVTVPNDATLSYNLIGLNVYDGAGANVGEIKDLVLSKSQLVGYILSVGGFLGMGEHYVAVAPSAVGLAYNDSDKKWKASINMTKDQLKAAPEFKYQGRYAK